MILFLYLIFGLVVLAVMIWWVRREIARGQMLVHPNWIEIAFAVFLCVIAWPAVVLILCFCREDRL